MSAISTPSAIAAHAWRSCSSASRWSILPPFMTIMGSPWGFFGCLRHQPSPSLCACCGWTSLPLGSRTKRDKGTHVNAPTCLVATPQTTERHPVPPPQGEPR